MLQSPPLQNVDNGGGPRSQALLLVGSLPLLSTPRARSHACTRYFGTGGPDGRYKSPPLHFLPRSLRSYFTSLGLCFPVSGMGRDLGPCHAPWWELGEPVPPDTSSCHLPCLVAGTPRMLSQRAEQGPHPLSGKDPDLVLGLDSRPGPVPTARAAATNHRIFMLHRIFSGRFFQPLKNVKLH